MTQQLISFDLLETGRPPTFDFYAGLGAEVELRHFRYQPIRGLYEEGAFVTALFGLILPNNFCTLFLVSKLGENYSGTQHQHLSYLDANFQAYKDQIGVYGFHIVPLDDRRVSLIETRLPLWERRGNTSTGEPLFVRED